MTDYKYVRLCNGLDDAGILVPKDDVFNHIQDLDRDWYISLYMYNEEHYTKFKQTGTIAGITDVVTNRLVWDFDGVDLDSARTDTVELIGRLVSAGITEDQINIFFSGNKGFSVELETTSTFTPSEFKNLTRNLSKELETRDPKIVNASRIFRVPNTLHHESKLYKRSLTLTQLSELSIAAIKEMAKEQGDYEVIQVILPKTILDQAKQESEVKAEYSPEVLSELDMSLKPKNMPACKYAIQNGFVAKGSRSSALQALGAHYKSQGMTKLAVYGLLKGVAHLMHQRNPSDGIFPKEEIWNNVLGPLFSPNWKGGTYACKDHDFLQKICPVRNSKQCGITKKEPLIKIEGVSSVFNTYATNVEKNTVKTGIKELDKRLRMMTKSHVVIAGSSGSGKSTLCLNILANASSAGLNGIFGSMDMPDVLVFQKIAQKVKGYSDDQIYEMYRTKSPKIKELEEAIARAYKNVAFDFRRGVSFDELRSNLLESKMRVGDNLKLVVYDYLNKISGPYSDENANMAYIAPKLADLADESETLIISLAQIARAKGGPGTPLLDSRVAKGSSAIEESATALIGVWRPGYNTEQDNFITAAGLKMRMGKEFKLDLHFNGQTSEIRELTGEEEDNLGMLRERLEQSSSNDDGGW